MIAAGLAAVDASVNATVNEPAVCALVNTAVGATAACSTTRLLPVSAMNTSPDPSTANPSGMDRPVSSTTLWV